MKHQLVAGFVSAENPLRQTASSYFETFAASGYRNSNSGGLNAVGTNGYSWSCSPNSATSVNGSNLNFNSGNVNPENNDRRSNGFPVRCVQENLRAARGENFGLWKKGSGTGCRAFGFRCGGGGAEATDEKVLC